jgi:hypothetical protein
MLGISHDRTTQAIYDLQQRGYLMRDGANGDLLFVESFN